MKVAAIIVCAGKGKRLGVDKAVLPLAGKPLFYHSVSVLSQIKEIKEIILVMRKEHFARARRVLKGIAHVRIVEGGKERNISVVNGLGAVSAGMTHVLIHDAARPFVDRKTILRVIAGLKKSSAVICGLACRDTVKKLREGLVERTVDRRDLFLAQTPQGFRLQNIRAAYAKLAGRPVSDDAQVIEIFGDEVAIVEGSPANFKITYPEDLVMAQALVTFHG